MRNVGGGSWVFDGGLFLGVEWWGALN